ncbi:hypothetical protein, partial [Bacteroides thetaiotaomicron]|uniref:hypothetical protein n=1 Tax=Bacteroides thetaiotaomicron TaxID=818 RepID=UPI00293D8952
DTIGGTLTCVIKGCPIGLGQPVFGKPAGPGSLSFMQHGQFRIYAGANTEAERTGRAEGPASGNICI